MACAGGRDVPAAELDRVDDEGCDLVEGDAVLPSRREREGVGVGLEARRAEATEEAHHRQVELPVAAEGGRIDQPVAPVGVNEPVAGPQVAVQPGRSARVARPARARSSATRSRSSITPGGRARARARAVPGAAGATGVEVRPGVGRVVRQPAATGRAAVRAPEAGCAGPVERRQLPPEGGIRPRPIGPVSIQPRARNGVGSSATARTAGRLTAPASASQVRPAASVVKNPGGGLRWVLTKTRRPSARSTW